MANDLDQSVSNAIAGGVSAPIDLLAWALRKAGVPGVEKPVLGSDWMREKGLTKPVQPGASQVAGETVGNLMDPLAATGKLAHLLPLLLRTPESFELAMKTHKAAVGGASDADIWKLFKTFKYPSVKNSLTQAKYGIEVAQGKLTEDLASALGEGRKLSEIYEAPQLYKAVPELKDLVVKRDPEASLFGDTLGGYDPTVNTLFLNPFSDREELLDTLQHEINHAVNTVTKQGQSSGLVAGTFAPKDLPLAAKLSAALREQPSKEHLGHLLDTVSPFGVMDDAYTELYSRSLGERLAEADSLRRSLTNKARLQNSPVQQLNEIAQHPNTSRLPPLPDDLVYEFTRALRVPVDTATDSFMERMHRLYK